MTIGHVETNGDVVVRLSVQEAGSKEGRRVVEALLDAGFNGFLALPPPDIEALRLPRKGLVTFVTADGARHIVSKYEGTVPFGEHEQDVEIVEAAEALIGAALLWGGKVCIHHAEDGRVEIEDGPPSSA